MMKSSAQHPAASTCDGRIDPMMPSSPSANVTCAIVHLKLAGRYVSNWEDSRVAQRIAGRVGLSPKGPGGLLSSLRSRFL
jgi:hypothetical protein